MEKSTESKQIHALFHIDDSLSIDEQKQKFFEGVNTIIFPITSAEYIGIMHRYKEIERYDQVVNNYCDLHISYILQQIKLEKDDLKNIRHEHLEWNLELEKLAYFGLESQEKRFQRYWIKTLLTSLLTILIVVFFLIFILHQNWVIVSLMGLLYLLVDLIGLRKIVKQKFSNSEFRAFTRHIHPTIVRLNAQCFNPKAN